MTNPDPFQRVQDEYFRLKGQHATGRITSEQFAEALKGLTVQDAQGQTWSIDPENGNWRVKQGEQWVEATPPKFEPPKPQTLPERHTAAPALAPTSPASVPQKSNTLISILLGALILIGFALVAFLFLFSNRAETNVALQPTNVSVVNPTASLAPLATAPVNTATATFTPSTTATPSLTATPALVSSNVSGVQVVVVPVDTPAPVSASSFVALNAALVEKIAALNFAELKFIRDVRASAQQKRTVGSAFPLSQNVSALLDQDLKDLAGKAMDVAILADDLSALTAKQDGGNAQATQAADVYANIARTTLSLVIDAQTLREQMQNGILPGASGIALIAEYGAQLWNSEVTEANVQGNPFMAFLQNVDPTQTLKQNAAAIIQSAATLGSVWLAQSAAQTTKTISVPPAQVPVQNPFDPQVKRELTTAEGQNDANKAQQVAAANLHRLGATGNAPTDPAKPTELQVKTNVVAVTESFQIQQGTLPTFPKGNAVIVAQNNSGDKNPFLQPFGLNGVEPPTDNGKITVQDAPPLVKVTISDIVITFVNPRRGGSFEAEVNYEFTVNWNANLASPQFELECAGGNTFNISTSSGSQRVSAKGLMILYPGAQDAYCYASRNGNTWGSVSVRFLVGDAAEATQRALQVETDAESLNRTLTADAQGTASAAQTNLAATVQILATQHALETEVGGTKTAEFKLTANAFGTKQAQPPPDTATPTATPTFTPKVVDTVFHPGNVFGVSTNVVLEPGRLYRFTFSGKVNLINPTRSVTANELPEHVNGIAVPASGVVVVEGTGGVATITCGSGEPDPNDPGGYSIVVEDLGPL